MAPTETATRASSEVASRDIVRHFVFRAAWAIAHNDVEVQTMVACSAMGRTTFNGYSFTFERVRITLSADGTKVSAKRNMFADEVELDLRPEQKEALFKECADALTRQQQERVRLQRDEAECAEERARFKREREYAQLAVAVSGTRKERE